MAGAGLVDSGKLLKLFFFFQYWGLNLGPTP
jgi:hypothetical protein